MSATDLRSILTAVREEHGTLTPRLLVDIARDPEHPLHHRFEWDDSKAAEKWRLEQAGQLLRVTYAPLPGKPRDMRAFMAVRGDDSPTSEYVPTGEALADEFTRTLLLRQFDREWKAFKRRYSDLREFADLILSDLESEAS